MIAIATEKLFKRYDVDDNRIVAVRDVSLRLNAGTFALLRGPSGSGKSTLLSLLAGFVVPTSGTITLHESELTSLREHHRAELRRRLIGFVFQDFELFSRANVLENVLLPALCVGGPTSVHRARAQTLLETFGLTEHRKRDVRTLSSGEQQRVALCRALLLDPPILLLDEPTAHLDDANVTAFVTMLGKAQAGTSTPRTIVAATHDTRLLDAVPTAHVFSMHAGHLEEPSSP